MPKKKLPRELEQECIWIVRGYDRRVKQYIEARRDAIESGGAHYSTYKRNGEERRAYLPKTSGNARPTEDKQAALEAIEQWPETKKMRAVEYAKLLVGADLPGVLIRQSLLSAILLNCEGGRKYPFEYLNVPGVGRTDFYRRKGEFLYDIAEYLLMI